MKKESGYTLVEILVAVALLGILVSLMWSMMVQNAHTQKRTKNEMEAQNSAKALLNHIGEVVMEQNVPVVQFIETPDRVMLNYNEYSGECALVVFNDGRELELRNTDPIQYRLDGKLYEHIQSVKFDFNENGRGLTVTVTAESEKANVEFSSSFYTRNT